MKFTLKFRIWHWLNAIVVLGLLGTVFLRKTFLSWRTNSEILMTQLSDINVEISEAQAKVLAKAVRAGMWEWHIILGYALSFLILYRVYLFIKDSSQRKEFSSLDVHKKAVRALYYVFYTALTFMAVSGLVIHFHEILQISKETAHDIKEIHELVFYFIMGFAAVHIAGVVVAENSGEEGLVSGMINGK